VCCLWVDQCLNDETQCRQGQVDVNGLFSLNSCDTSFGLPFTTSQIHQVQLAGPGHQLAIDFLLILNNNRENRMRPGRLRVHLRLRHHPMIFPHIILIRNFLLILNHKLTQPIHLNPLPRPFMNFQRLLILLLARLLRVYQQVNQLLIVQLQKCNTHEILLCVGSAFDCLEDVLDCPGDDACVLALTALHCVGLACACLPVGEDCAVVALEDRLDDG
jgi:hypothetical protein